eukprot:7085213-Prymnesium_polylepis.1
MCYVAIIPQAGGERESLRSRRTGREVGARRRGGHGREHGRAQTTHARPSHPEHECPSIIDIIIDRIVGEKLVTLTV